MKNQTFGDWQEMKLSEIATISRGGSPRPIEDFITEDKDGLNWLRIGDIDPGAKYVTRTSQKIKTSGLSKTTLVKSGDFILSNSMSFGRPYIMKIDACIHDGWLSFKDIKTHLVLKEFLYYLLTSEKLQNIFKSVAAGSGVKNLKRESVSNISVALPPLTAQQKIVDILSTIDQDIVKTDQIIQKIDDIKQGLMQRFFIAIKNSVKFCAISDLGEFKRGPFGGALKKEIFVDRGFKVYEQKNAIYNDFSLGSYFIDAEKFEQMKGFALKSGDIIISCSGTLGKVAIVPTDFQEGIINQALLKITPSKEWDVRYIKFLLESSYVQDRFTKVAPGSAMKNMASMQTIKSTKIIKPALKEQQKIADILSGIDLKLSIELKHKNYLTVIKHSLMNDFLNRNLEVN